MTRSALPVALLAAFLAACAGTPPATFYTLDDGRPPPPGRSPSPSVAVLAPSLPELIDRPQLVLRGKENRIVLSEQQRWAEPLGQDIARLFARDLGELLDSSRVLALPADVQRLAPDFRLSLDIQRLDAIAGEGANLDVVWHLAARSGPPLVGRSTLSEAVGPADDDPGALVAAQRRVLRRAAGEVAAAIRGSLRP